MLCCATHSTRLACRFDGGGSSLAAEATTAAAAAAYSVEDLVKGVTQFVKRLLELDTALARSKDACRSFEAGVLAHIGVGDGDEDNAPTCVRLPSSSSSSSSSFADSCICSVGREGGR